jgi:small subunit ribosomal protein S1
MDGLIHISELSWSHVNHPSEVLEIGQDVKVKVLDIDRERPADLARPQADAVRSRGSRCSRPTTRATPVEGKVTKVVTFGAFVEIMPGVEGLVHISELAQHHVENPREVVSQGDLVKAKIIEVDAERRRLSLSLKRVEGGGVTERADDVRGRRGHAEPRLSEEVFPEEPRRPERRRGESADDSGEPPPRPCEEPCRGEPRRDAPRGGRRPDEPRGRQAAGRAGPGDSRRASRPLRVAWRDRSPSPSRRHRRREERGARRLRAPRRGASSRATRSSIACCARTRSRKALRERFGDAVFDESGDVDRGAIAEIVFADREALEWLEGAAAPARRQEYMEWREQLAELRHPRR